MVFFPGLSHFPRSEKAEISFKLSDSKSYETYTNSIKAFLEPYNDSMQINQQKFENCGGKCQLRNPVKSILPSLDSPRATGLAAG